MPGGDYGFIWDPIGTNAQDFEYFVNLFGYTPAETLSAATMLGGQIMDMPDLGLVKEGFLADLLLVDGDPTADIKILQDRDNLLMIMKDGAYFSAPQPRRKTGKRVDAHARDGGCLVDPREPWPARRGASGSGSGQTTADIIPGSPC